jgi:multidrug transporter EmrE-like cation transporter
MGWVLLTLAGLPEVVWATGIEYSEGAHLPGSAGYASLSWFSVPVLLAAIGLSLAFCAPRLRVLEVRK